MCFKNLFLLIVLPSLIYSAITITKQPEYDKITRQTSLSFSATPGIPTNDVRIFVSPISHPTITNFHTSITDLTITTDSDSTAVILFSYPDHLPYGAYYVRITNALQSEYSMEMPALNPSPNPVKINTPSSHDLSSNPTLTWERDGLPAFHLILSSSPIVNTDDLTYFIDNASIVWQTITTENRFTFTPQMEQFPSLLPSQQYTLIIAPSYDINSPLLTDFTTASLLTFTQSERPQTDSSFVAHFENLLGTLPLALTTIQWMSDTSSNNSYELTLLEAKIERGIKSYSEVLTRSTTENYLSLPLNSIVTAGSFRLLLHTLDGSGTVIGADTAAFVIPADSLSGAHTSIVQFLIQTIDNGQTRYLDNATITLTSLKSRSTKVIKSGSHLAPLSQAGYIEVRLEQGPYHITIEKMGFEPYITEASIESTTELIQATLHATPQLLTGRVIDHNKLPIPQLQLILKRFESGHTSMVTTDNLGRYFATVSEGHYSITSARNSQYETITQQISIQRDSVTALQDIIVSHTAHSMTGAIADQTASPIANAQIMVYHKQEHIATTQTDQSGFFQLQLSPGRYTVQTSKQGFSTVRSEHDLFAPLFIDHTLSSTFNTVTGSTRLRRDITQNSTTYQVVPDQQIWIVRQDSTADTLWAKTDEYGYFSLSVPYSGTDAPPDTFIAGTRLSEYAIAALSEPLIFDAPRKVEKTTLTLYLQATITGSFTLSDLSMPPVSHCTASLIDTTTLVSYPTILYRNDSAFVYSVYNIPRGVYRFSINAPGFSQNAPFIMNDLENIIAPRNLYTIPPIVLTPHSEVSTFIAVSQLNNTMPLKATVDLTLPLSRILDTDSTYALPDGIYHYSATAHNDTLLPIAHATLSVTSGDTIMLPFNVAHNPAPLYNSPYPGTYTLTVTSSDSIDSGYVYYETPFGIITDTIIQQTVTPTQTSILFGMPKQIALSAYSFKIFVNGICYSNNQPGHQFITQFSNASSDTLIVSSPLKKSFSTLTQQNLTLSLSVSNSNGHDITTLLNMPQSPYTINWSISDPTKTIVPITPAHINFNTGTLPGNIQVAAAVSSGTKTIIHTFSITLIESTLDSLSVIFPPHYLTSTIGGDTLSLMYLGHDSSSNTPMLITPPLTLSPNQAGTIIGSHIHIDSNFIGPLSVIATLPNLSDTLTLSVGQSVSSLNSADTLFHDSLLSIVLPDSLFLYNTGTIHLHKRTVEQLSLRSPTTTLYSDFYALDYPYGQKPYGLPSLNFSIPEEDRTSKHPALFYDDSSNTWLPFTQPQNTSQMSLATKIPTSLGYSILTDSLIAFTVITGRNGYYGLTNALRDHTLPELAITPNPFSPSVTADRDGNSQPGTRIDFYPFHHEYSELEVTLTLYNMNGEIVRTLAQNELYSTEQQSTYWDGLTDSNRMARNGRYLLRFTSCSFGSQSHIQDVLKPVVLFK
ncbi:MAG: carboxypeptidase regulatory-like domain-containing protein [Fibrobacterales bacterium]